MSRYQINLREKLLAETDWQPLAEAAWGRACTDRDAQIHGGFAELRKNGKLIARVMPRPGGHPWPDGKPTELNHVAHALIQLLRDDEWDAKELAAAMTDYGLPTSRHRIDSMRKVAPRLTGLTPAELVVMLDAVLDKYKNPIDKASASHYINPAD